MTVILLDDFFGEININIWPIEMTRRLLLNVEDDFYCLVFEPREVLIGHEQILASNQQPHITRRVFVTSTAAVLSP